jgi:TRAP-type C4-dicarboxylate transport system substrate-binding protein
MKKSAFLLTHALFLTFSAQMSSAQAQEAEVKWTLVSMETTREHHAVRDAIAFAKGVSDRTNGRFNIRVALEGELGFKRDAYVRALMSQQVQMATIDPGFASAQMPHFGVFNLPFLQDGTLKEIVALEQATLSQTTEEFKRLKMAPCAWLSLTPQEMISSKPVPDFTNLEGTSVRVWRELDAQLIKKMNGVPVYLPGSEVYLAMQRGVVTMANTGTPAMLDRSLEEVGKHVYRFGGPPSNHYVAYNIAAFTALPADYKSAFQDECKVLTERGKKTVLNEDEKAVVKLKKAGVQIHDIPASQKDKLRALSVPLWGEWAEKNPMNKKALDAAKTALHIK